MKPILLRSFLVIPFVVFAFVFPNIAFNKSISSPQGQIPQALDRIIQNQESLPRYVEAGYSPLGRSPVVDAVLSDPFYLPTYAWIVSEKLKEVSLHNSLYDVYTTTLAAGGIPLLSKQNAFTGAVASDVPEIFTKNLGESRGAEIYSLWQTFVQVYREAESALAPLSPKDKQWLREHYEAFFFGEQEGQTYDFFTTDSPMPLKFFNLASQIDIAKLADCARQLSLIVDYIYQHKAEFASISFDQELVWEEQGLTFIFSGRNHATHTKSADFFLALGGNNTYYTNAGGTEGTRAAALHVNLQGNNTYFGNNFVQGSGFLGVGVLATFSGNNTFKADSYSQGAGFFGAGLLMNLEGNNRYEMNFAGQSFAVFGSSLVWNKGGHSSYLAHGGMSQAASSTLGVAFLIDNTGNNSFVAGISDQPGTRLSGIGQGSSIGVRGDPWVGHASFYGGVSFLYNGGGQNKFAVSEFGQGSAYFLGTGILVDEGESDDFYADLTSQGQALHLAAGLLLKKKGNARFIGGWGSLGVAGDRSVGMFINTEGNNRYEGTIQSIGTARKPKALGVFIDLGGNNDYNFGASSNANIQKPRSPLEWPNALFLTLGGHNSYPQNKDEMQRGANRQWGVEEHGIGIDANIKSNDLFDPLIKKFPSVPRNYFPFDPLDGWSSNTAYRPLIHAATQEELETQISEILTANYDHRRHLYESIDLFRFTHPDTKIDFSELLQDPAKASEDLLNYAVLVNIQANQPHHLDQVLQALDQGSIDSGYSRKMALKFVAKFGTQNSAATLAKVMETDSSEENRAYAAYILAKLDTPNTLDLLESGLNDKSEKVRYSAAAGLQDSPLSGALEALKPLFHDASFYVRRAAAMTAISLGDKEGIPVLLETLQFDTLDTGENYGDNLYNTLSKYVGVSFGLNKDQWLQWWDQVKDTFEFPTKVEKQECSATK